MTDERGSVIVDCGKRNSRMLLRVVIFMLAVAAGSSSYYAVTRFPRMSERRGNVITAREINETLAAVNNAVNSVDNAYITPSHAVDREYYCDTDGVRHLVRGIPNNRDEARQMIIDNAPYYPADKINPWVEIAIYAVGAETEARRENPGPLRSEWMNQLAERLKAEGSND